MSKANNFPTTLNAARSTSTLSPSTPSRRSAASRSLHFFTSVFASNCRAFQVESEEIADCFQPAFTRLESDCRQVLMPRIAATLSSLGADVAVLVRDDDDDAAFPLAVGFGWMVSFVATASANWSGVGSASLDEDAAAEGLTVRRCLEAIWRLFCWPVDCVVDVDVVAVVCVGPAVVVVDGQGE
jgi:hypothetical protein